MATPVIDVWFDFVCPWCFIGHRHLQQALREWDGPTPSVRWRGVSLIPDVPPGGLTFTAFYENRLGGPAAVQQRQAQVQAAAAAVGEAIAFDRITRFPDSSAAHRLYTLAQHQLDGRSADALMQRLFTAYFQRGEDIGNPLTLTAIGLDAHLPLEALSQALWAPDVPPPPPVQGVPFFQFQDSVALSGAQPAHVLLQAMRQAFGAQAVST